MGKNLLIVESYEKSKVIGEMLGPDWIVRPCFGHIRDLPDDEMGFEPPEFIPKYVFTGKGKDVVSRLKNDLKSVDGVYLATDPDREGEAISWHLAQALKISSPKRVTYTEITSSAVRTALANPRSIDMPLVYAQEARRIADRDVGYPVSKQLSEKFNRRLSAGRVQSPAQRLIVDREREIDAFKPQEYWTIHLVSHKGDKPLLAKLIKHRGNKVEALDIGDKPACDSMVAELKAYGDTAKVEKIERKQKTRNPSAPFTTSTLQQEAVRKLGFSTKQTMRVAQQLYDGIDIGSGSVGLITYMRTDGINLAEEALQEIRDYIGHQFDARYLPKSPVQYKSKSKNAQEAHEAIRPTSIARTPESVRKYLNDEQFKLYEMIWKRTLACQISPAEYDTVTVDVSLGGDGNLFRANGQILSFPGFMAVYLEVADDDKEEGDVRLPQLEEGETLPVDEIASEQHFTQPPPRYTEATLVKTLEEYGIGRPSTYASIVSTLLDRGYAVLEKKKFIPTPIGITVIDALVGRFSFAEYTFTSSMEESLDAITQGKMEYRKVLQDFHNTLMSEMGALRAMEGGSEAVVLNAPCPKCGGKVESRGRTCNCLSCEFKLWKEVAGRSLSDEEVTALLRDGILPTMAGFRSRAGGKFSASLKLDASGKTELIFDNPPGESGEPSSIDASCPKCGGRIQDKGRLYACEKGDFTLWKEIAGRKLAEREVLQLLRDKEIPVLDGFISAKGKKFSAGLRLSKDLSKVEFVFTK